MWTGGNGYGDTSLRRYAGPPRCAWATWATPPGPCRRPRPGRRPSSFPYTPSRQSLPWPAARWSGQVRAPPGQGQRQAAAITKLELHSSGPYGEGDAISVGVIFNREITVAGTPQLSIEVGGERRTAAYDTSQSGPHCPVLQLHGAGGRPGQRRGERLPRSIVLPVGASITDSGGSDAELAHSGLAPQPDHTVDGSLQASPPQQQQATNNEPQFSAARDSRSVDENATAGTGVGSPVTATDVDGDALTYALTGSSAFAIGESSGQITVLGALDHETQSGYSLTVTVSDGKDASGIADDRVDDSNAVTVSVVNVEEPGTVP